MTTNNIVEAGQRYSIAGIEHEVISVDSNTVLFGVVDYSRRFVVPLDEVLLQINRGLYKLLQAAPGSYTKAALYLSMDDKTRAELKRKLSYVTAVTEEFSGRLPKAATKAFLKTHATNINDTSPPGYTTLRNWVNLYREANANPLSLVPKDKNRKPSGKTLDAAIKDLINYYIELRYLTKERATGQSILNSIKAHIKKDNAHKPAAEHLNPPGRATVYRYLDKIDPHLRDYARYGANVARKNHKYGKKIRRALRLLERVEMDSHCIDLIIVDVHGRILARAWLCAAMDTLTGVIQAWEISLTPPCAEKTLRVLKQCLSSKNPYGGKAENYYVDNGAEFQNSPVINLLNLYNSKITFVPPKSPDQKPMIERFFGTLNTQLIHLMPGTTRSNPTDRGDYQSEKYARITLKELRAYFKEWLDTVYHVAPYGDRHISPKHAWEKKINESFMPERYAEEELNLVCRSYVPRIISGGRVTLDKLSWYGPSLPTLAAKLGKGVTARVYYDPTDLGTVFVADPNNPTCMTQADATNPEYQNGLTLYEHRLVRKELIESECKYSAEAAMTALADIHERIANECLEPLRNTKSRNKRSSAPRMEKKSDRAIDAEIREVNLALVKLEQAIPPISTDEDQDDFETFTLT